MTRNLKPPAHPFRRWRDARGISQADAATKLGIRSNSLCSIERNKRMPSAALAARMALMMENDNAD